MTFDKKRKNNDDKMAIHEFFVVSNSMIFSKQLSDD